MNAHAAPTEATAAPASATWSPPARPWLSTVLSALFAAGGVALVMTAWGLTPFASGIETTENAYVQGRTTVISPQVSGYVTAVPVADFQTVTAGAPLVRIDSRIYTERVAAAQAGLEAKRAQLDNNTQADATAKAGLDQKTAALAAARASLGLVQADADRAAKLVSEGTISRHAYDVAATALERAKAAVAQAEAAQNITRQTIRTVEVARAGLVAEVDAARAQRNLARIALADTVIRAPETGILGVVGVHVGQYVTNGTQLFSLVPADRWVTANFKETQTAQMAPGDPVTLTVDALDGAHLEGHLARLAPATGSEFAVIKADNGTGNFIKIPQRIGVRITIDPGQPLAARLRPGMSVEARVDTRART